MRGPEIITRTLSLTTRPDPAGNRWQYRSRSDHHSKVACWAIAFDLLAESKLLRDHIAAGVVTFGINRQLNDFETGKKKDLDLVIARAPGKDPAGAAPTIGKSKPLAFDLNDLAKRYDIQLSIQDRQVLADLNLPPAPVGIPGATVLAALEAKACMTEHIKALPRLHDELTSSHGTVHGDTPNALSIGFVMVNTADQFWSPGRNAQLITVDNPPVVNRHVQPHATERTVAMLKEVRRRAGPGSPQQGFDALGIMLIDMTNDGREVKLVTSPPAPPPGSSFSYEAMIRRAAHLYDVTFPGLA
ncbi:hypothetical protein [Pseudonocardia humida]|uniref:Nucleotidyltransferase AbiEii toxin of type IV toxin-antitoxin system n=1 Tax=Pseudonocardia humida TaxID=2800819 RepID=A0ABT1A7A3_9PSEU|nr:hypothetical protein [Pseudonocardia humida]MCO1658906.1 hypothetical protein [Pseudonocardia humida]